MHTHNQWSFMIKINLFVGSVKKDSRKLKTFSYDNCNKDLAHSQSVLMDENKIMQKNQFVVSVQKVYIITISEDAWGNSWKLKTYLCSTCNENFANSQSVTMHEKSM